MAEKKKIVKKTNTKNTTKKVTKSQNSVKSVNKVSKDTKKVIKPEIKEIEVKEEVIKKDKVENKRLHVVIGVIALIAVIIIASIISGRVKSSKLLDEVNNALASDTPTAIYLMKDGCTYCELNANNIASIENDYNVKFLSIDISKLTSKDLSKMLTTLNIDGSSFGTPYLVVVQNNEVKDTLDGVKSYNLLFSFLQDNGLISKDANLYLNYIDYDQYKDLINSDENQIIVLASSTCHYCMAEHPILIQIAKDKNVKINFMYLDYAFSTQDEYTEFKSSLSWFSENSGWGTPTTLIVKNNKVVASLVGYYGYDDVVAFYTQNGMIK